MKLANAFVSVSILALVGAFNEDKWIQSLKSRVTRNLDDLKTPATSVSSLPALPTVKNLRATEDLGDSRLLKKNPTVFMFYANFDSSDCSGDPDDKLAVRLDTCIPDAEKSTSTMFSKEDKATLVIKSYSSLDCSGEATTSPVPADQCFPGDDGKSGMYGFLKGSNPLKTDKHADAGLYVSMYRDNAACMRGDPDEVGIYSYVPVPYSTDAFNKALMYYCDKPNEVEITIFKANKKGQLSAKSTDTMELDDYSCSSDMLGETSRLVCANGY